MTQVHTHLVSGEVACSSPEAATCFALVVLAAFAMKSRLAYFTTDIAKRFACTGVVRRQNARARVGA